jgi:hypothetical protein
VLRTDSPSAAVRVLTLDRHGNAPMEAVSAFLEKRPANFGD